MMTDTFEADLRRALARRAADVPETSADRLRDANYRPQTRVRPGGLTAVGVAAVGVAAVGVAPRRWRLRPPHRRGAAIAWPPVGSTT